MIVFDFRCKKGHTFEGWFADSGECTRQMEEGILLCPMCGESRVDKLLSPVKGIASPKEEECAPPDPVDVLKSVSRYVEENFEDVGADFTREALKMHMDVTDKRNIRGTTSEEEDKLLEKEGVPVLKFPIFKRKLDG
jgi:hypothetical protein